MKVAFEAQIMQNNIKSLRSMDKEARLILEYSAEDDELISNINKLHSAKKTVTILITDELEKYEKDGNTEWRELAKLAKE